MLARAIPASSLLCRQTGPIVGAGLLALFFLAPTPAAAEPSVLTTPFTARFQAMDARAAADDADKDNGTKTVAEDVPPQAIQAPPPPDGRAGYRALIEAEARRGALAPEIAEAVMAVESGYNPGALGGAGEIGLMQILPSTARVLGFSGTLSELAVPATNIHYGVMYLAEAWRLAGGDLCTAVMKYRAGHGETRFSYLSVNYCVAVRGKLFARGYPVTGSVPVATFGEAAGGLARGCGRRCLGGGTHIGTVNIAALNTRLTAIVAQARGGR
jgi:soluble lytic murein transglycosylase-like protein